MRYQHIAVGSKDSEMPFLELVAIAVHSIAVDLFKLGLGLTKYAAQPSDGNHSEEDWSGRRFWPFHVRDYILREYPDGPADTAGYWAKNCKFYELSEDETASLLRFLQTENLQDDNFA